MIRSVGSSFVLFSCHCRSYEDDEGDDEGKQLFTPMSVLSQDYSDIDCMSSSAGNELYRSANSSPLDSPSRSVEQGSVSPLLRKCGISDQGSLSQSRKYGADSEDLLENSGDCASDNLRGYINQESQKAPQHFNFENDRIFYPPLPEDKQDDTETSFFGHTDEEDDVEESDELFKSSESHKEALRNAVHAHFRALVSQLLKGEGVHAGNDSESQDWLEIVSSLAWQAANFVKPDTSKGGSMDPGDYVKVKCIASGSPNDRYEFFSYFL